MSAKIILLVTALIISITVNAQNIEGRVIDGTKPVENATVSLLRLKDTTLIRLVATDKEGKFTIEGTAGQLLLKVTAVGYISYLSGRVDLGKENIVVPAIQLRPDIMALKEVKITSSKPLMQYQGDKLIVNLDVAPSNAGANLLEVLAKMPGVTIDAPGNITLKGKAGVLIMIDGKETFLSGDDLTNLLRNMPASLSDQIEIISNPSSRYDAATTGGIINIKSKKSLKEGFNGSFNITPVISLYHDQGNVLKTNFTDRNSLNWNYKKDKVNLFGNAGYSLNQYFDNFNEDRFFYNNGQSAGSLTNQNFFHSPSRFYQFRTGMDYYVNEKSIIGFIASNNYTTSSSSNASSSTIYDANGIIQNYMLGSAINPGSHNFNGNYNINYKYANPKNNEELTADVNYVLLRNVANVDIQSHFFDAANHPLNDPLILNQQTNYNFDVYVAQVNYTRLLGKWKMETGAKASYTKTNSDQMFQKLQNGIYVNDTTRSNNFLYKENINALYFNLDRKFDKLNLQMGLRAEQTIGNGFQQADNSGFKRSRIDLFPSVFLNYEVTANYAMSLNYSRKVTRPSFRNLNPFVFVTDSLYSFQGNPFLLPQFSHNFEFNNLINNKISIAASYFFINNLITNLVKTDPVTKVTKGYVDNFNNYHAFILTASIPFELAKWWTVNTSSGWVINKYSGIFESSPLTLKSDFIYTDINNTLNLSADYSADVNFSYTSKNISALIYFQSPPSYSIGIRKKFTKGSIVFTMNDPFVMPGRKGYASYGTTVFNQTANFATQSYNLSFTYRFGKTTVTQQRNKKNATDEEQRRL